MGAFPEPAQAVLASAREDLPKGKVMPAAPATPAPIRAPTVFRALLLEMFRDPLDFFLFSMVDLLYVGVIDGFPSSPLPSTIPLCLSYWGFRGVGALDQRELSKAPLARRRAAKTNDRK